MNRALRTLCPGCGAQVEFRAGSSVLAVCPYCRTTLVRKGDSVENLGKMAEVFEDHSPLQLGARGTRAGTGFGLVGRLQYRYPRGTWNEWYALADDGSTAWLSEDNGQYVWSADRGTLAAGSVPGFEALAPEQRVALEGREYTVVDKEQARVVAGAGELPFVVGPGYEAPVADLRDAAGGFATLDYSDAGAGARLYVGERVDIASLRMAGLREDFSRTVATEGFTCPNCGAPVQATLTETRTLTCPSCASVLDLSAGVAGKIAFWQQAERVEPLLAPGASGTLDGTSWTVVGFMRRSGEVDGERFSWDEFLLHEPANGFRFLTHEDGHWCLMRVLQQAIATARDRWGRRLCTYEGRRYDLYGRYDARVDYVSGEFYWRVERGETTANEDYIAPPLTLSRERSENEVTWSHGRYLRADEIEKAFGVSGLPRPRSIGMIEPARSSRWRSAYRAMFLASAVAILAIQAYTWLRGSHRELVPVQRLDTTGGRPADHLVEISGSRPANLVISADSNVHNDSFDVDVSVVDQATGQARSAEREVGFWEGTDSDGEHWTEGSRSERFVFAGLPPGKYLVRLSGEHERTPGSPAAAAPEPVASYRIEQDSRPTWLPFLVGLPVVWVLELLGRRRAPDPETERWSDSLYGRRPGLPATRLDAADLLGKS